MSEHTASPVMMTRKRSRSLVLPSTLAPSPASVPSPTVSASSPLSTEPAASTSTAGFDETQLSSSIGRPPRKKMCTCTHVASLPCPKDNAVTPLVLSSLNAPSETSTPVTQIPEEDPFRFEPKRIILGTLHCKISSYLTVQHGGVLLSLLTHKDEKAEVLLPFASMSDYFVCDSSSLPLLIIQTTGKFGEIMRAALPSLKKTDENLSDDVFDPLSKIEKCHSLLMFHMKTASSLCDLISKLMQNHVTQSRSASRIFVPRSINIEEAKKRLNATQRVLFKWKECQVGTWKAKPSADRTIHMSGSRIKFKVNLDNGNEVTLSIQLHEVLALMLCVAQANPVLFIRATDNFAWEAREKLEITSVFQQGRDYYHPDSPETRFKYMTFKLEKQGVSREIWQNMYDVSGDRFFTVDHISSRIASEMLHKLTYQPIQCKAVRVGANELDEIRAITIHFDSICICGCMLDSVITMNICIADIKELNMCMNEKHPVLLVKTSTAISDTLKRNMGTKSTDVFFDPNSKDIKKQYILLEIADSTSKETVKKIYHTLQAVLINFNDRINVPKDQRANFVKLLSKKNSEDLIAAIKEPLPAKDCICGKKEDLKWKEEVADYMKTMTQKHGCGAVEKVAARALDLQKKIVCSVCMDRDCQVVFTCGHMICERCDQSLRKCHICRLKISKRIRIFI